VIWSTRMSRRHPPPNQVDPKRLDLEKPRELVPEFIVPVGLALRGWVPLIRLNLLPKNLRRQVEPGWWRLAGAIERSIQRVASPTTKTGSVTLELFS
jgi:hypothetical protein